MTVDYNINSNGDVSVQDGLAEFKLNSYTVQAIASLNFPIINFIWRNWIWRRKLNP
jgi:hypothetical protein